jgi:glycine cleavage system H protein
VNVPAGVFISPEHAWAKIELNGMVRIGPDDLIRKIFERVDHVELPHTDQVIEKGNTLFSISYGDYDWEIPSPLSGRITSVNTEHADHPEWLAIKPFELSWMCSIEPVNLAEELPGLRIGLDSLNWYQDEIDRYQELANKYIEDIAQYESSKTKDSEQGKFAEYTKLLNGFSETFLQR